MADDPFSGALPPSLLTAASLANNDIKDVHMTKKKTKNRPEMINFMLDDHLLYGGNSIVSSNACYGTILFPSLLIAVSQ